MLAKLSVKKAYTVLVAVVLVIVLGVVSFMKMSTDLLPNISLPYVIVMTTYPGASPETVEMVVTKPVEASMATVSNIEGISSVSSENYSMVILEFAQSADMNGVSLEIRENLDQIKSYWDDSIGSPIIMKLNPDMLPVMIAAVGYEGMDTAEVSEYTQNTIIPELESIEGVASASATGLLKESVHVIIRQEKIDEINKQVFGSIDEEMEEAIADLQESKQEILDGQSELADARKEMNSSKQDLLDSQKQLDDSRQELEDGKKEIADGKAELADGKTKLEEGKKELADKKEETAKKLAEGETQLLTAKADAEAAKVHMATEMSILEATNKELNKAIKQIDDGIKVIDDGIAEIQAGIAQIESLNALISSLNSVLEANPDAVLADLPADLQSTLKAMNPAFTDDVPVSVIVAGITSMLPETDKAALEAQIEELNTKKAGLEAQKQELSATVTQNQALIKTYKSQLSELESQIEKLDKALKELYAGNLTAAIEFSNAQTTITLTETQLTAAETQLEASEEQIKAGQEQLDSGQEQIDAGWEQIADGEKQLEDSAKQLEDAMQQILDGEEQIEEAREDAYAQADMHGILTVETVSSLLMAQNFSMPGGYVTEEGIDYLIRVGDKPKDIETLKQMPLLNTEMEGVDIVTLGDVADVFMTDNSDEIYANVNGEPGIMVSMQKQTGYSTGDVSDRILERFEELTEADENLMLITLMDQGIFIDLVMDSIIGNVLFGGILAVLILLIFLKDLRPTAVVACSIPISLIAAVVCMYFSGVTLNVISLSGLALGVGMLVDNSIVVIENIYRLKSLGYSAKEAAIEGANEVAGAILASTLTTVCVFLPIVFTEGITRQLFVDMGLTFAYSLMASLFVALTVVPAMASKTMVTAKEQKESKIFSKVMDGYGKFLGGCLKLKPVVLIVVLVLTVVSALLAISRGTAFMPEMDSPQMTITLTMPKDTPLTETGEVSDEMVARLMEMPEVSDVGAMASDSSMGMLTGGGNSATNSTTFYLTLDENKTKDNVELASEIEKNFAAFLEENQAELSIQTSTMDMSALGGSGISVQIEGRDMDTLQEIAKEVAAIVEGVEGTKAVSDGLEESTGEMRIIVDRQKAIEHGLTVAQIFQQIQVKIAEATSATTLETELKEYDVYVKHANDMALTRELIKKINIERTKQDGTKETVPLTELATFEETIAPKSVNRSSQTRYISVSAAIADGYNIGLVSADVEKALEDYQAPAGYRIRMTGENEMIMEAIEQLMLMLVLALIFMYLIMVAQFQSLLLPFIIMFTIPLAFTGGFMGLYLSGSEVSVIAIIGFVMLSGVIVNNGIVLVDYINQLRAEGMSKKEAIITAGRTRMRPVLMTALTTILALSTMAFSDDMGADLSKPMSVVTIGGLIYGTLLTLIVIPCVYDIFTKGENKEKKERKRFGKKKAAQAVVVEGCDE